MCCNYVTGKFKEHPRIAGSVAVVVGLSCLSTSVALLAVGAVAGVAASRYFPDLNSFFSKEIKTNSGKNGPLAKFYFEALTGTKEALEKDLEGIEEMLKKPKEISDAEIKEIQGTFRRYGQTPLVRAGNGQLTGIEEAIRKYGEIPLVRAGKGQPVNEPDLIFKEVELAAKLFQLEINKEMTGRNERKWASGDEKYSAYRDEFVNQMIEKIKIQYPKAPSKFRELIFSQLKFGTHLYEWGGK